MDEIAGFIDIISQFVFIFPACVFSLFICAVVNLERKVQRHKSWRPKFQEFEVVLAVSVVRVSALFQPEKYESGVILRGISLGELLARRISS